MKTVPGVRIVLLMAGNLACLWIIVRTVNYRDTGWAVSWLDEPLVVRLCTTGEILEPLHNPTSRSRPIDQVSPHASPETAASREENFVDIFRNHRWGISTNEYGEVRSGEGSTLAKTVITRKVLQAVVEQLRRYYKRRVIKMLDIPCGDFTWMNKFLETDPDIDYTGMDIVPDLIQKHQQRFANITRWRFRHGDIVNEPLGEQYDLILCRDMIIHLSTHDVIRTLQRISESQTGFLLMTHYPYTRPNTEINLEKRGRFRRVNLMETPYSLVNPICFNEEDFERKFTALWRLPLTQNISNTDG